MKILFGSLVFFLLVVSCKKQDAAFLIDPTKITETDIDGNFSGTVDPTDWRFDDVWSQQEVALFNYTDTVSRTGMQVATDASAGASPNPATDVIMFTFRANKPTLLKVVITDAKLKPIFSRSWRMVSNGGADPNFGFAMDVRHSRFQGPGYYRIYYALADQDGNMYKKGHGDFRKL